MSYQVPQHIDPNKVFLINHSELEGRLDSDFYNPSYYQIFDSEKVKWVRLKTVIKNLKHPPEYKRVFATEGYQLIRSQNVRPSGINLCESPVYLADKAVQSSAIFPHVNDILIVRSGVNAGDVAVVEEEYKKVTIGADTLLLNVTQDVLPKFVQIYFMTEIGRKQLNRHITGATNKHLNSYSLKRVYFPKVNLLTQSNCVSIIESAFVENKQKEEQAKALLQSIDEYLLGELGIERPSPTRTENGRFFYTSFHNLMGSEWAPLCIKNNGKRSKSTIYKEVKLSTIATIAKGQAITSKEIVNGNYPVIAGGQSSPYSHNQYNYKGNIVTISASGAYSGYVWYHNYPIFASDCSVIFSNDENVYLTKYIYEILRLRQQEIYLLQKGAGQPHVYPSDIANLIIPAIPLEKQQDIVAYCQELRNKAELLQKEGRDIISTAKDAIEQMIIGN